MTSDDVRWLDEQIIEAECESVTAAFTGDYGQPLGVDVEARLRAGDRARRFRAIRAALPEIDERPLTACERRSGVGAW